MKYPYIGEYRNTELTVLFTGNGIGCKIGSNEYHSDLSELKYKNITAEYLSNTWGVVESKEHAEFIIELAELHGFKLSGDSSRLGSFFSFSFNGFGFLDFEFIARHDSKQITIPLPPKAKAEKPDLSKLPKHFDCVCNKCGGRCCVGNCDEWPQVGDVVTTRGGSKGVLIVSKPDNDGMVICNFDGEYALTYLSELQKIKTPEDELRDGETVCGKPKADFVKAIDKVKELESESNKRNKSKQAYEILKSLDYEYDLDKQKWFKKHYI